jgi:signal transduction histidine kinase
VRGWAAAGPPRSRRDWLVDTAAFLLAAGFGFGLSLLRISDGTVPAWLLLADQIAGGLGCASVWLRRRWPVELAIAMIPLTMFSETVGGAFAVALFSVAVHRPVKTSVWVAGLSLVAVPVYAVLRPDADLSFAFVTVFGAVVTAAVLGWGLFVRNRRQLLASLTERTERAEAEARLRAEHAQSQAREQIAREMHDVLGHRLSLLSVQAGALEYRRDASAAEIAGAASVIRASAHQALEDLREVIGVLRAEVSELPQPTLADVDELVAESRRAGMRVVLRPELGPPGAAAVPERLGRTAYRIVQEGLTNARKHAPEAEVGVWLSGSPELGLTIELVNTVTAGTRSLPGAGQGLIGLAERAMLAGGYLVGQRVDRDQDPANRVGGHRVDGQRAAGQRADGHRVDGHRADGHRADGQRAPGQAGEGPGEWRLWAWLPWPA